MSSPAETLTSPILAPEFASDPYPVIHRLHEEDPIHWVPGLDLWYVFRDDDVKRLLHDPENATNDSRAKAGYIEPPEGTFDRWVSENQLFSLSHQGHARIHKLVADTFKPRAVARMEELVRETIERIAAPLCGRSGVVDLMAEYTNPIPNAVISRITGVPAAGGDEVRFRELAQLMIQGFFAIGDADELRTRSAEAFVELADRVREMIKERRDSPREDLVSDLVQAHAGEDHMSDDEIALMITGLLSAGSETTAGAGMVGLMTLLSHPEVMERLREDRSLLENAVLEILRWGFGGLGGLPRYAVRDFELRGKRSRTGQTLMLSFAGAQRAPAVYENPDVLDIDRNVDDLTVFSSGPHYCLGVNLARQELRCMFDAALDFLPRGSRFREDMMKTTSVGFFQRPANFPVELVRAKPGTIA